MQASPSLAQTGSTTRVASPAPRRAGPYHLGPLVGRGGLSDVYAVEQVSDGQQAVLKLIRHLRAGEEATLSIYHSEVGALQAMEHPGIVQLLDHGITDEGRPFLVLPRLTPLSLRTLIGRTWRGAAKRRGLAVRHRLIPALVELTHSLEHAHERGWLHRDLKPSNVLLDRDGSLQLIDWGVAVRRSSPERQEKSLALEPEDRWARYGGTPGYMGPEQILRRPSAQDERSDVWSLGAILFEMVVGHRLVAGAETWDLLEATVDGRFVAASSVDPVVAPFLPLALQACAVDPRDRPRTVAAFRDGVYEAMGRAAVA